MTQVIVVEKPHKSETCMKYDTISKKIIKNIELVVRNSYHYKLFIHYLKHVLNMNECAFYEGYSLANGLSVEIHHSPITLFEYTLAIANKHLAEKEYYKIMEVADEVSRLHYEFLVGLVPLNCTAHELVHNQELSIHPDLVLGNWEDFYNTYQDYASEDLKQTVNDAEFAKNNLKSDAYPAILRKSDNIFQQVGVEDIRKINISKMLTDIKLKSMNMIEAL